MSDLAMWFAILPEWLQLFLTTAGVWTLVQWVLDLSIKCWSAISFWGKLVADRFSSAFVGWILPEYGKQPVKTYYKQAPGKDVQHPHESSFFGWWS